MFTMLNRKSLFVALPIAVMLLVVMLLPRLALAGDDTEEVRGLVNARPTDTLLGEWTIGDVTMIVDEDTEVDEEDGPLALGSCADAEYAEQEDGSNLAVELESKSMADCEDDDDENEINGIVESFPTDLIGDWVIDGVTYSADANTRFRMEDGPFAVGACVEIEFDAATMVVSEIKTSDDCDGFEDEDDDDLVQRVYGPLEAFPVDLIGDWVVGSITYTATADTEFDEGTWTVGECVEVNYIAATLEAVEIEDADDFHCGPDGNGGHTGDALERYGTVEAFPAELIGEWTIDGEIYTAGAGTEFETEDGDFAVGVCVEIKYLPTGNIALEIEVEDDDYHCGGDGPDDGSFQSLIGNVESFPVDLIGEWVVDGQTFTADETTLFDDEGSFEVGTCVDVTYQTTNNLALEIEIQDPFDCGDDATPPTDEGAPALRVNHANGANGSNFVFTAENFAADSIVVVQINGQTYGQARTNSRGWVTFAVNASYDSLARAATNNVRIRVSGTTSNVARIAVTADTPLRNLPAGYSAPVIEATAAPTAITLGAATAGTQPMPLALLAMLLVAPATLLTLYKKQRFA